VTFAGEVANGELPALLRSADVMVSATAYDPAGVAVIQGMACGLPVVASAVGGQRDAVLDGITGLLVEPEHPGMLVHRLRALLAQPAIRQAYGIAAADRARSRYGIERTSQETAASYERCLRARVAAEDVLADADEADEAGLSEMAALA
jgi:glycosyltransferase involved in cell wall biosynthesis